MVSGLNQDRGSRSDKGPHALEGILAQGVDEGSQTWIGRRKNKRKKTGASLSVQAVPIKWLPLQTAYVVTHFIGITRLHFHYSVPAWDCKRPVFGIPKRALGNLIWWTASPEIG